MQEFDLQLKIIDHFCPLGRFSGGPKANTLYHTVSFKHHMPAASQPRICERKYLEPPRRVSTPPSTHTHTQIQADNDGIACQNPAPLTSDIRVIAFRCYLSCRYSGWLSCHHGLRSGNCIFSISDEVCVNVCVCVCVELTRPGRI